MLTTIFRSTVASASAISTGVKPRRTGSPNFCYFASNTPVISISLRCGGIPLPTDDANVSFRVSCKGGKIVSKLTSPDTKVVTGIFWAYGGFKPGIAINDPQLCTSIQDNYGRGLLCKVNTSAPAKEYEITVSDKATTNKCQDTTETVTH